MTEQDMREMMVHPTFKKLVHAMVADIVHAEIMPRVRKTSREIPRKVPPIGMLTYKQVAKLTGLKYDTVRSYVHAKIIVGHKGFVSKLSLQNYVNKRARNLVPIEPTEP